MDVIVNPASWTAIRDFDGQSREMYCSTTGQPRRQGEPVFRGAMIDLEGFYDICVDSAKQLAEEVGYVPPEEADRWKAVAEASDLRLKVVERKLAAAIKLIDSFTEYGVAEGEA